MTLFFFLALTFAISLTGYACIVLIPGAKSPETPIGLPFWLIMVWGPSLAAILVSLQNGKLIELLGRTIKISTIPIEVWGLMLAPLVLVALMKHFAPSETSPLSIGMFLTMVAFNLILGPLGEELGWRGVMQEHLSSHLGWLEASLIVGVVWFAWHLPLWTFESPHSQISLHLFGIHCMLYAVIIGAAYALSGGSILPAIILHLTFNLASNTAVFAGFQEPNAWFKASIWPYIALSAFAITLVYVKTDQSGFRFITPVN